MPEYGSFLRAFGIRENMVLDGYKLESYQITHKVVEKYREYDYDTILNFEAINKNHDFRSLIELLKNQTRESRTVNSRWGNPYQCWFGHPEITHYSKYYSQITVLCLGHASRIHY